MTQTERAIRKTNSGAWAVVEIARRVDVIGILPATTRVVDEFTGPGAKRAAIRVAGTNRVIA